MATVKKEKTAERIEVVRLYTGVLHPSPAQKRRFLKDDAKDDSITALAVNIERDGQIEPIIVRPHPSIKGEYEIVCGERRTRACRLLDQHVQAIVRDLDDKQAAGQTASENIERKNLTPVEEAETLEELTKRGWTAVEIADSFKLPLSHVLRRMQLTNLSAKWRAVAADPESFARSWNAVHLEKIAKFPPDVQDSILAAFRDENPSEVGGWTTKMLAGYLAQFLHSLDNAPWKKDDETLVVKAGACAACKKRSDCQPDLFEAEDMVTVNRWGQPTGKVKAGARCLDPECWDAKAAAYLKRKDQELKEKHNAAPLILAEEAWKIKNSDMYKKHPFRQRVQSDNNFRACKESDAGAKPALYIDGPRQGQIGYVKEFAPHSPSGSRTAKKKPGEKKSLAERRGNLEMLRSRIVAASLIEIIEGEPNPPGNLAVEEKMALILTFGTDRGFSEWGQSFDKFSHLVTRPVEELADLLHAAALPVIATQLQSRINSSSGTKPIDKKFLESVCYVVGAKYEDLYARACEQKKEPKSWAKEVEDAKAAKGDKKKSSAKANKPAKDSGPVPGVCRVCGCTETTPCVNDYGETCAWADAERTLCSACFAPTSDEFANEGKPAKPKRAKKAAAKKSKAKYRK